MQVTKKIPRGKLLSLYTLIQQFEKWDTENPPKPPLKSKFVHALAINQEVIDPIWKAFGKVQTQDKEYLKYEMARQELARSLASKDANGNPMSANGMFIMGDNDARFQVELLKLQQRDEFKEAVLARQEYLLQEVEVTLQTVDIQYVPDVGLVPWKIMMDFITDTEKEKE